MRQSRPNRLLKLFNSIEHRLPTVTGFHLTLMTHAFLGTRKTKAGRKGVVVVEAPKLLVALSLIQAADRIPRFEILKFQDFLLNEDMSGQIRSFEGMMSNRGLVELSGRKVGENRYALKISMGLRAHMTKTIDNH
jgi:hypothetical protein